MLQKFAQPSSWAGIAGLVLVIAPNVPSAVMQSVVSVGAGICALLAFFLDEKSK